LISLNSEVMGRGSSRPIAVEQEAKKAMNNTTCAEECGTAVPRVGKGADGETDLNNLEGGHGGTGCYPYRGQERCGRSWHFKEK
jgi:hypothetical protein